MPETMKLFGRTKNLIDKTKKWRKHKKPIVEAVLVQCNLVDNQYKQKFEVSYFYAK